MVWVFLVSFYNSLTPIPLIALIGFFTLGFWLDKLSMFYRNSTPISVTKCMSKLMLQIMEIDMIIFTFGNLVTMILVNNRQPPILVHHSIFYKVLPLGFIDISIIALAIALIYKIVVEIVDHVGSRGYQSKEKSYSEVINSFRQYYWS